MTYILLAAFILSAVSKDTRMICLCMVVNLGMGLILYDWMLTADPSASAAAITLINVFTIIGILAFGERHIQKVIQPLILVGFIAVDTLLTAGLIYDNYEIAINMLYGLMLLTILKGVNRGGRYCFEFISNTYSGRHSDNDIAVRRNNQNR